MTSLEKVESEKDSVVVGQWWKGRGDLKKNNNNKGFSLGLN